MLLRKVWTDQGVFRESDENGQKLGKRDLFGKTDKFAILPKECLIVACCLLANVEEMVAERTGLGVLCFEQRGLEVPGLN